MKFCAAYLAVKANKGAPGVDGMSIVEAESHLREHWESIKGKLLAGKRFATIEYSGGRVRLIGGRTDELGPGRLDADRGTPGIQLPVENGSAEFDLLAPDVPQDVLVRITSGGVSAENSVIHLERTLLRR